MTCYKEVELIGYEESVSEFLPKVLELLEYSESFYNDFDLEWFDTNCPIKLLEQIKQIGGTIDRLVLFKVCERNLDKFVDGGIHIDSGIADYRLNLPLMNSDSIETRFYADTTAVPVTKIVNKYGGTADFYIEQDLELIDKLVMSKPVIFPVKIPHGLFVLKDQFPRYILSIQFKNDLKLKELVAR